MKQPPKFRIAIPDVARLGRLEESLKQLHLEVDRYRLAGSAMLSGSQLGDSLTLDFIARICRGSYQAIVLPSPLVVERLWSAALEHRAEETLRDALISVQVLAIGERTREALENNGARADHVLSRDLTETPDELYACLALDALSREPAPSEPANSRGKHIVVVGHGMVAHRFSERLMEHFTGDDDPEAPRLTVIGEEPRVAYDRVRLTSYMSSSNAEELSLTSEDEYASRGAELKLNTRVDSIDRPRRHVLTARGERVPYDVLVLATGARPFVPPIEGTNKRGVFVYRTLEDLDQIREYAGRCTSAAVLGGGLLGLEAAKALMDLGLRAHVVEAAPRLMPRQLDERGADLLKRNIEALGVQVHLGRQTTRISGSRSASGMVFDDGTELLADLIVISAGIRPRDELARHAGLEVGARGGISVDDQLRTSDPRVFAVGECAVHRGELYGLVGPGYAMADVLASVLLGEEARFEGADTSTKLKLLGVDVATFGDPFAPGRELVMQDWVRGIYKKLIVSDDATALLGGMLVGDVSDYSHFVHLCKTQQVLSGAPEDLIFGRRGETPGLQLPDSAQVCSCNNVSKGDICVAVREGNTTLAELKQCTRAGTGCGGCIPLVSDLIEAEMLQAGTKLKRELCEHFPFSRQELFEIVRVEEIRTFEELIARFGRGHGCEVCRPVVASILASVFNELVVSHPQVQDTNDRFLANIQRGGLYSVVPRVPGGEITPEKLIVLGQVAKKYNLYTKITGGQRIDLFGAHVTDLPRIWEELVAAGFESGHAYGKAMRTVKSCVGSTWCRYGVQDSTAFAIRLEERYKGIRAPHKLKSAVSGCIRECAEAQSKDFGLIATEKGWNVYVGGNGGAKPRHAELLVADVGEEAALRYLDRFLMYYIRTADKLTRTSVWIDKLDGGIEHVRDVVVHDRLGICETLEREMSALIDSYHCEWRAVVEDPERRAMFRHFAGTDAQDGSVTLVQERGQVRPEAWPVEETEPKSGPRHLPVLQRQWVAIGTASDFSADIGTTIDYGGAQIAVFNFKSRGEWYATQNLCPHKQEMVLARGLLGDQQGVPKVACPLHKKTFSLETGGCLSGDSLKIETFPVKVEAGVVYVELPPEHEVNQFVPSRCNPTRRAG